MQSIVKLQFIILIFFSLSLSQDCDENMLMYDCVGTPFCNNEATFGYDCYVNNQYCEDFNGDGILDIVVHGEGHRCGTGGTYGKSVTQDGRWSCESKTDGMVNAQYPPFVLFNQDPLKSKVTIKQNVFDFAGPNGINIGYGSTVARNVMDDFNGDGIDGYCSFYLQLC